GDQPIRWNLFARELEDILAARGLRLGHLDDLKDAWGGPLLHRGKVHRLQQSLKRPKWFSVLNPGELERVIQALQLTTEEQVRLQAAMLATAVEVLLVDRLDDMRDAVRAAEQLLPLLQQALSAPVADPILIRGTEEGDRRMDEVTEQD